MSLMSRAVIAAASAKPDPGGLAESPGRAPHQRLSFW